MNFTNHYTDKLAFIAGGSEGIGKAIAIEMVAHGAHVVITSRHATKLEAALKTLENKRQHPSQKISSVAFDLTSFHETEKNLTAMVDEWGVPDYLIHCAGYARPGYLSSLSMEQIRSMMELNYFGFVHATKVMAPFFIKKRGGTIVSTASIAGFVGLFGYTGYCGSKYAILGFSEALRRELKIYGIRVSVLCPPNTNTPGLLEENKYKPPEVLKIEEKIKVQEPHEVAKALLKQLPKNPFIITTNFDGHLSYLLSRWAPSLVDFFVKRPKQKRSVRDTTLVG